MRRVWTSLVIVGLLIGASPSLRAAEPSRDELSTSLFDAGRELADAGRFEDAIRQFRIGYDVTKAPFFLYSIAACEVELGHRDEARALALRYLDESAGDARESEGRARAQRLLQKLGPAAPARAVAPPPAKAQSAPVIVTAPVASVTVPAAKPGPLRHHWWIFPVGGVVLAGVAVGIYFGTRSTNPCNDPYCLTFAKPTASK